MPHQTPQRRHSHRRRSATSTWPACGSSASSSPSDCCPPEPRYPRALPPNEKDPWQPASTPPAHASALPSLFFNRLRPPAHPQPVWLLVSRASVCTASGLLTEQQSPVALSSSASAATSLLPAWLLHAIRSPPTRVAQVIAPYAACMPPPPRSTMPLRASSERRSLSFHEDVLPRTHPAGALRVTVTTGCPTCPSQTCVLPVWFGLMK